MSNEMIHVSENSSSREVLREPVQSDVSLFTTDDLYLFNEGTHYHLYEKFGAHPLTVGEERGTYFAVWAPNAERVSVIGDFNSWNPNSHPLLCKGSSGIWEGFVPQVEPGHLYKYNLISRVSGRSIQKGDPFAFRWEVPPKTASVVWDLDYTWNDEEWMNGRRARNALDAPLAIYEVHLGSWQRSAEEDHRFLTYEELAPRLIDHVRWMGFTHVELMPVMEHPFYGSWGYQVSGFFAPTSRYGSPQDLMSLIDALHQNGIGVILDWVPSHFPTDEHGLALFDGTHLYEHADLRQGLHPEWGSLIFNYGRHEVRSFLISNAMYWLEKYHLDGLRVDAVASMLYLDYGRKKGEWIPNQYGGRENLDAVDFLRHFNKEVYARFPDVQTIAEESTAWPMVTRPTHLGGLGFGLKWDMGWMHDTLRYLGQDPIHRQYHHNEITFRSLYALSENYVLPLSHDEVVHGKSSLLGRMPGDDWQKFANLRLLFGYMYAQTGKKLLFMGGEIGQWNEWYHESSLDWHLLAYPPHEGVRNWVADLNRMYRGVRALHERDCEPGGFEWVDGSDHKQSILCFLRRGRNGRDVLVVCNFTPVPRENYRVGVSGGQVWGEILNSDHVGYGGSGVGNAAQIQAEPVPCHGRAESLNLTLPPLGIVFLKCAR